MHIFLGHGILDSWYYLTMYVMNELGVMSKCELSFMYVMN